MAERDWGTRKRWLAGLADTCGDLGGDGRDAPEELRNKLSLQSPEGEALYRSFGDEELLDLLREAARRLGHSPAQKEVFWAYRAYLKKRFGKWPYALEQAGLSRSAGAGGRTNQQMEADKRRHAEALDALRAKAAQLGRMPHRSETPELQDVLRKYYHTWGEALEAAGVPQAMAAERLEDLEPEYQALLEDLRRQALALGRPPQLSEVDPALRAKLVPRCGSWRNTLYQIGLEPVAHIRPFSEAYLDRPAETRSHKKTLYDCYYQVLDLDEEAKAGLRELEARSKALGRAPRKSEVPAQLRRTLQDACGSWSNALYQIGLR